MEGFDPTFNDDESFKIATDILRFASRTQSSGAAYEAMTYIFKSTFMYISTRVTNCATNNNRYRYREMKTGV